MTADPIKLDCYTALFHVLTYRAVTKNAKILLYLNLETKCVSCMASQTRECDYMSCMQGHYTVL